VTLSSDLRPDQFWVNFGGRSTFVEPRDPASAAQAAQLAGVGEEFELVGPLGSYRSTLRECFVVRFGASADRLGRDVVGMPFDAVFPAFWRERIVDRPLTDDTELFVAVFVP
jgi:hypothetical protein